MHGAIKNINPTVLFEVLDHNIHAILVTDATNKIVYGNKALLEMFGYSLEELLEKNPSIFSSGKNEPQFYDDMFKSLEQTGRWKGEVVDKRKDGSLIPIEISTTAVRDESNVINYVAIMQDVSERKLKEQQLRDLAFRDPVTGLYNRRMFDEQIIQQVSRYNRTGKPFALILLDLDNFGGINNKYGHVVGDQALREFATRVNRTFRRETDIISRFGGDEFAVLITDILAISHVGTMCKVMGERLLNNLKTPYEWLAPVESIVESDVVITTKVEPIKINISASIGIGVFEQNKPVSVREILENTDKALYESKRLGKKMYSVYYN